MKVKSKSELNRAILSHPTAGKLRGDGSGDWPDDSYTHRRIEDGDLEIVEEQQSTEPKKPKVTKEA